MLFLSAVLSVLRGVPIKVWLWLGAIAAVVGLLTAGHLTLVHKDLAENDQKWSVINRLQKAGFEKQIKDSHDAAQAKLDALGAQVVTQQLEREAAVQAAEDKRLRDLAALKKGFAAYVTPLQLSRCSDMPRGYLVRRANAASYANGGAEPTGPPSQASALDQPSGVSLAEIDSIDADQAGAYRACHNLVLDWEQYGRDVDDYFAKLKVIFQPKGTP